MKKIFTDFLSALFAAMLYWSFVQYYNTGSIDWTKLIFNPAPWIVALVVTAGIFAWTKFFRKKETEGTKP